MNFDPSNASHVGVINQIFGQRDYDIDAFAQSQKLRAWEAAQTKYPLIVDAGAHIGASAVWFHQQVPKAHIVSIEPEPSNFSLLQQNTGEYGMYSWRAGISCVSGRACIHDPGRGDWGYRVTSVDNGVYVNTFGMDEVLRRSKGDTPYIAKIDIEGGEAELFSANTEWVERFPLIIIELHDWLLPGQGTSRNFLRTIAQYNFDVVPKGENLWCFNNEILK